MNSDYKKQKILEALINDPHKERSAITGRYVHKGTEEKKPKTTVTHQPKKRGK